MCSSGPEPLSGHVRARMRRQGRQGTAPEIALRKALFARGLRFRVQYPVPGAPRRSIDIAFPRQRVAVLVDGCFWHACPEHGVRPKNNAAWWNEKLDRNRERDILTDEILQAHGWVAVRIWEHVPPSDAVALVLFAKGLAPPRHVT